MATRVNRIQIGTRVYEDQLSTLDAPQMLEAARSAPTRPGGAGPNAGGAYSPNKPIAVEISVLGGAVRRLVVHPTDLTRSGMGCLVGVYLHEDLECAVQLVTTDGEYVTVGGRTGTCAFIRNRAHYLEVRFDNDIDVDMFIPRVEPVLEDESCSPFVSLIERMASFTGHRLTGDYVTILSAESSRCTGNEAILHAAELSTPTRIAVVGFTGNILAVNPAWLLHALDAGYEGPAFSSVNYVEMLEAHRESCATVIPVLNAFAATTVGSARESRYAYECQDPSDNLRFFSVRHTAERRMSRRVVVVTHERISGDMMRPEDSEGIAAPGEQEGEDRDGVAYHPR